MTSPDHTHGTEPTITPGGADGPGADAPTEGKPFGRYRLLSQLGHGGMGVVWKAWDTALHRHVAIKGILSFGEADRTQVERFQREAQAAARLRHPNIVTVHDVGLIEGQHYICADLVEGESLDKRTAQPWPVRKALELVRAVAEALQYAHDQGIVHRDVKPANILLDAHGTPFVADFGLAKDVRGSDATAITGSGDLLGTPSYMSPEQARGNARGTGPASDQFSLGVVLYELLTGRRPFAAESHLGTMKLIAEADPPRPTTIQAKINRDVETICLKALEKDPSRRYARVGDLAADIGRYLDGEPIEAKPIGAIERLARKAAKHRAILIPTAAAVLLGVAAAIVAGIAKQAREGEGEARAAQGVAESRLEKAQLVADVLGRWSLLGPQIAEMERLRFSALASRSERKERIDAAWASVEQFLQQTAPDPASRATARALAAWPRYLAAGAAEGTAWARSARGIDADVPFPQLMSALILLSETVDRQPMPGLDYAPTGLKFLPSPADTPEQQRSKSEIERLLAEAETCAVWGREGASAFHSTVDGLRAFQRGDYAAADRAFSLAIPAPDLRSLRNTLLSARAFARFYGSAFQDAILDLEVIREARPESASVHVSLGDLLTALAFQQERVGGDPRDTYRKAIASFDAAERLQPDVPTLHLGRGHAWDRLAQAEAARGADVAEMVASSQADFRIEMTTDGLSARYARYDCGQLLSWWGMILTRNGGDPFPALDQAVEDFTHLLRDAPDDAGALSGRGYALTRLGEARTRAGSDARPTWELALAGLDRAIDLDGKSIVALANRGHVLILLGEAASARGLDPRELYQRADADLRAALRLAPEFVEGMRDLAALCLDRARLAAARGDDPRPTLDEGIRLLDRALGVRPGDPESLLARGSCHSTRAEAAAERGADPSSSFDLAVADLDAVLAVNPSHPAGRLNRGNALLRRATWERSRGADPSKTLLRACDDFDEAVKRQPFDVNVWSSRAAARLRVAEDRLSRRQEAGEWIDGAIADLGEALARNAVDVDVLLNRGAAWFFRGQAQAAGGKDPRESIRKALADFDAVIKLRPGDIDARMNRASTYMALADSDAIAKADPAPSYTKAIEDLDLLLSKAPGVWEAWQDKGRAHEGLGDVAKAVEAYERAYRLAGDSVPAVKQRLDAARAKLQR